MLSRLAYFSRNALRGDFPTRQAQLAEIVKAAQRKNEFAVITGFLISYRSWFLQIIEGERAALADAYQRILKDRRHTDVLVTQWTDIQRREFVTSLGSAINEPANEATFNRHALAEPLERRTPKASAMIELALDLQRESLAKKGVEALFM